MRRWIMSVLLGLLSLSVVPAAAQGSITGVLTNDSNFTLLNEMIAAADNDVITVLNSGGYTFLAPTNEALRNLEAFLEVPLESLQQDEDIVTTLLLYHLIEGRVSSEDIRTQYDGGVVETLLENAFINFDVLPDNTIQINDVVEVTQPDVVAGDSVIHVVNDVLLNRVITDEIPDDLPTLPTDAPITETATEAANATPGQVRLIYAADTSANAVDVYINGVLAFGGVAPQQTTELLTLAAAAVDVVVTDTTSTPDESSLVSQAAVPLRRDTVTTFILTGALDYQLAVVEQSLASVPADRANVTFWNALDDADAVEVRFDEESALRDVTMQTSQSLTLAAGTYAIEIVDSADETVIAQQALTVTAEQAYLLVALTTGDETELLVTEGISSQAAEETTVVSAPTAIPTSTPAATIRDAIENRDDLQTLLDVIQATEDESILSMLDSDGNFTLFAPSDEAFIKLLASLDMSLATLAANRNLLSEIIRYHVLEEELTLAALQARDTRRLPTLLNGTSILIYDADTTVLLNEIVRVETADIRMGNGVIHIIDNVLLPPSALNAFNED